MEFPGIIFDTSSLSSLKKPDQGVLYDMLIVGGGAAAMSAAVYAARKMINFALITLDFGGLIKETSEIDNYLGFQNIQARDLIEKFEEHVKSFDIPINVGVPVTEITKKDNIFTVLLDNGSKFSSHTIIFSTGEHHRPLNVPGEREFLGKGVAYCATCDAPLFKDKKVVVAGGGNSAFITALDLMRVNAEIFLVNFSKGWQADETIQQRVKKYENVHFLDNHEILRINGKDNVESVIIKNRTAGSEEKIQCDGVFIEVGLIPNSGPVKNLVKLNELGEVAVDYFGRTDIPGFYAAGDVTSVPYKQIVISAGDGAKATLSAYDFLIEKSIL
jgi:alkyl hydroperoxide reductase subunit F